jgi:hypothetical protein
MEFRPRDDSGPCRHEFPAMVEHLLLKLCRLQIQLPQLVYDGSSSVAAESVLCTTCGRGGTPSLRDECERTQRKVHALDTEVAHLNRLVISQDHRLETQERQLEAQQMQLSEFRSMIMALQSLSPSEGVPPTTR